MTCSASLQLIRKLRPSFYSPHARRPRDSHALGFGASLEHHGKQLGVREHRARILCGPQEARQLGPSRLASDAGRIVDIKARRNRALRDTDACGLRECQGGNEWAGWQRDRTMVSVGDQEPKVKPPANASNKPVRILRSWWLQVEFLSGFYLFVFSFFFFFFFLDLGIILVKLHGIIYGYDGMDGTSHTHATHASPTWATCFRIMASPTMIPTSHFFWSVSYLGRIHPV